jgi:CMP-N-acetylneuraminic acid synthetase
MHNYLTIIPARKNSKRLKNKNLTNFYNKPLINFTFDLAKKIKKLDYVLLSSDDEKIIKIAKKKKINAPFKRPSYLSGNKVDLNNVVTHAVEWYEKMFKSSPKNIVLLQPTSPLRNYKEINKIIEIFEKKKYESLLSISHPFQDPKDLFYSKGKMISALKHDSKNIFFVDGSIYLCKTRFFKKNKTITNKYSKFYRIEQKNSFDINNKFELDLALAYYSYKRKKNDIKK